MNISEYIREAVKAGSGKIWFADTASHGLVSLVPAKRRLLKVPCKVSQTREMV